MFPTGSSQSEHSVNRRAFCFFLLAVGQLERFVKFENKHKNCWMNSIMQMLLATGHIVDIIRRLGRNEDDSLSTRVMVIVDLLYHTLLRHDARVKTQDDIIINESHMRDIIGYLASDGVKVPPCKRVCVLEFFDSSIAPLLRFYKLQFETVIDAQMDCSSCKQISSYLKRTHSRLVVTQTALKDTFDNVLAELFDRTPLKKICPKCSHDGDHQGFCSLMNCPKDLFVGHNPTSTPGQRQHILSVHVDLTRCMSRNVVFTRSYPRYTLQSFITFHGEGYAGHYMTYAQHKGEWFCFNDMTATPVAHSSLFGDQAETLPIVMTHFVRPSITDVFSIALWNVFTDFSPVNTVLTPTLSLNDAASYFSRTDLLEDTPLDFIAIKYFACAACKSGKLASTYFIVHLYKHCSYIAET